MSTGQYGERATDEQHPGKVPKEKDMHRQTGRLDASSQLDRDHNHEACLEMSQSFFPRSLIRRSPIRDVCGGSPPVAGEGRKATQEHSAHHDYGVHLLGPIQNRGLSTLVLINACQSA
jgi:hypothetical protein